MAKTARSPADVNKSEEIRNTIRSGVRKPKDVQARLAERGIQVSTQMVSTVKSSMKARRKARKIRRGRAAQGNAPHNNGGAGQTDIKSLARFIAAVQTVGGPSEARKILQQMER